MHGEETEPYIQKLQGTQKAVPYIKGLQEGNAKVKESTVGFLLEGRYQKSSSTRCLTAEWKLKEAEIEDTQPHNTCTSVHVHTQRETHIKMERERARSKLR